MSDIHGSFSNSSSETHGSLGHDALHEGLQPSPLESWTDPITPSSQLLPGTELVDGNPGEYVHDWFFQNSVAGCGPSAITQVIETQTGIHLSNFDMVVKEAHDLKIPLDPNNETGGLTESPRPRRFFRASTSLRTSCMRQTHSPP